MLYQHCNKLYTGYCLSCGGIPNTPEACDECGNEIGEYDEWHAINMDRRNLCNDCYAEWLNHCDHDEGGNTEYEFSTIARSIGRKIRDHGRWARQQGCPEGIGADAGAGPGY